MQREDIDHRFTYHSPSPSAVEEMTFLRNQARVLAHDINEFVPDSREKSLAITALEEVIMWANAGIARNGVKDE